MNDVLAKGILIIVGLLMFRFYAKRKSTFRSVVFGMASGGAALVAFHYLGDYIGFSPPLNIFNTALSLIFGIPGVVLLAVINMIL